MAEILSQDEVDALLEAVEAGELELESEAKQTGLTKEYSVYDFRRPNRVSKEQKRDIQALYETFCREFSMHLGGYLRMQVEMQVLSVEELIYQQYLMALPNPTFIGVFDIKPVESVGVLEVSPSIAYPIIERLLGGGGGTIADEKRIPTTLEMGIFDDIMEQMLEFMQNVWGKVGKVEYKLSSTEVDTQFVMVIPPEENVIVVNFEIKFGEASGGASICLPYIGVEHLLRKLGAEGQRKREDIVEEIVNPKEALKSALLEAEAELSIVLGTTHVPMGRVASLKEGDIIVLSTKTDEGVVVRINGKDKFYGKPGRLGKRLGALILEKI